MPRKEDLIEKELVDVELLINKKLSVLMDIFSYDELSFDYVHKENEMFKEINEEYSEITFTNKKLVLKKKMLCLIDKELLRLEIKDK